MGFKGIQWETSKVINNNTSNLKATLMKLSEKIDHFSTELIDVQ